MLRKLKENDNIAVIAISYPYDLIPKDDLYIKISDFFARIRYKAILNPEMLCDKNDGKRYFFANNVDKMGENLITAFNDEDIDCIWALRGGYGAANLLPFLDLIKKPDNAKLFIGYSDLTILHVYLNQNFQWPTLHYKMVTELITKVPLDGNNFKLALDIINGNISNITYELNPINEQAKNTDKISGKIFGGNLTLLTNLVGTKWALNTEDAIIFVEDVDERGYSIDRSLLHLYQAGFFNNAKALVVGNINCTAEEDGSFLCDMAIKRFSEYAGIPVFSFVEPIGHVDDSMPLVLGIDVEISQNKMNAYL